MRKIFIIGIMICVLTTQFSLAQIPRTMSYQGIVTDAGGAVVTNGEYDLAFGLYETAAGGSAVWAEHHPDTQVASGVFSVILGEGNPANPLDLAFDRQYWLEITVDGIVLAPRIQLASSPYSLNASSVADNAVTTGKIADGAVTSVKIADGQVVRSINGKTDDVILDAGANVTISENGNTLTISSTDTTGDDWKLTGNAGTSGKFLGTTDDAPLDLRVNNSRAFRLEPDATSPNLIGGFSGNKVWFDAHGATISGGGVEGFVNEVTDRYGTVGGGYNNQAGNADEITYNTAFAAVGGGNNNTASGYAATVGGGWGNTASGYAATIIGGGSNIASGSYANVAGGYYNKALGNHSFAAGTNAIADEHGSFVFTDSQNTISPYFTASAPNEFAVYFHNGMRFFTRWSATDGTQWSGVRVPPGGSAWSSMSDRNIKANFARVDGCDTLDRLASIPIETWNYKSQALSIRHIGPMAQDFYAAFGLGEDDRHISTIDADGVALAAIQGLYEIVKEKDAQIAAVKAENAALKERLDEQEVRLKALEAIVSPGRD